MEVADVKGQEENIKNPVVDWVVESCGTATRSRVKPPKYIPILELRKFAVWGSGIDKLFGV